MGQPVPTPTPQQEKLSQGHADSSVRNSHEGIQDLTVCPVSAITTAVHGSAAAHYRLWVAIAGDEHSLAMWFISHVPYPLELLWTKDIHLNNTKQYILYRNKPRTQQLCHTILYMHNRMHTRRACNTLPTLHAHVPPHTCKRNAVWTLHDAMHWMHSTSMSATNLLIQTIPHHAHAPSQTYIHIHPYRTVHATTVNTQSGHVRKHPLNTHTFSPHTFRSNACECYSMKCIGCKAQLCQQHACCCKPSNTMDTPSQCYIHIHPYLTVHAPQQTLWCSYATRQHSRCYIPSCRHHIIQPWHQHHTRNLQPISCDFQHNSPNRPLPWKPIKPRPLVLKVLPTDNWRPPTQPWQWNPRSHPDIYPHPIPLLRYLPL